MDGLISAVVVADDEEEDRECVRFELGVDYAGLQDQARSIRCCCNHCYYLKRGK
jgi:hypothetical protein